MVSLHGTLLGQPEGSIRVEEEALRLLEFCREDAASVGAFLAGVWNVFGSGKVLD